MWNNAINAGLNVISSHFGINKNKVVQQFSDNQKQS